MKNTFSKHERLSSKKDIESVFKKGEKLISYPFFFMYHFQKNETPFQIKVLVSASKKKFKKASDRNRIKRICREVFRNHKQDIYAQIQENIKTGTLNFALVYVADNELNFAELVKSYQKGIKNLADEIKKHFS